jgi:hypothetical protein
MEFTVDGLKAAGAFTGRPVEREIVWKQGEQEYKATVHVRPLSYRSAVSDLHASVGRHDATAGRIAACICDANGAPVFTPEDITGDADPERGPLDGNLTMALLAAIAEVNRGPKPTS